MGTFLTEELRCDDPAFGLRLPASRAKLRHRRPGFQKILYRAAAWAAILGGVVSIAGLSAAQEEMPQITPREKNAVSKKSQQGPRALGLLQLTSNGKASLVPIAIRIDGKFYGAAAYKAAPVPMALESGTVYEGESTGKSVGLFTINGALRSIAVNSEAPWIGTGLWLPAGTEPAKTGLKAEVVPVGIETTDEPPRLTKAGVAKDAAAAAPPAQTTPTQTAPTPPTNSAPSAGSNPGSPRQPSGSTPPSPGASKPADQATKPSSPSAPKSQPDDGNRPRLRRGKPTEPLPPDEDIPGYAKPNSTRTSAAATATATTKEPSARSPEAASSKTIQLVPAISDAGGPEPRAYTYESSKDQEDERRKQMLALANAEVRAYLAALVRNKISATPAKPMTVHKTATKTAKTKDPELEKIQIRTFDLWGNNQPVLVLTAESTMPVAGDAPGSIVESAEYSITLVARTDIYNELHKIYSGVTDKFHLDVTPRLELIDAVDADGDGRGELLFRETTDAGHGYVIYRPTADKLWKLFDSLNQ
jgi:hypothetical protein